VTGTAPAMNILPLAYRGTSLLVVTFAVPHKGLVLRRFAALRVWPNRINFTPGQ
jgi:hypothetical protein